MKDPIWLQIALFLIRFEVHVETVIWAQNGSIYSKRGVSASLKGTNGSIVFFFQPEESVAEKKVFCEKRLPHNLPWNGT